MRAQPAKKSAQAVAQPHTLMTWADTQPRVTLTQTSHPMPVDTHTTPSASRTKMHRHVRMIAHARHDRPRGWTCNAA